MINLRLCKAARPIDFFFQKAENLRRKNSGNMELQDGIQTIFETARLMKYTKFVPPIVNH